jgi:hypothetical protein
MPTLPTLVLLLVNLAQGAGKPPADRLLDTKVTLNAEGITLGDLLTRLATDTGAKFAVTGTAEQRAAVLARKVGTVAAKEKPLGQVLDGALKPLGVQHKARKDYIEVSPAG